MNKLLSRLADLLGLGIHQRVARAKKKLHRLEQMLINPHRTQRWVLDSFFCRVADLLSFGKVDSASILISQIPPTDILNLDDFGRTLGPFDLLSTIVSPLIWLRRECHYGHKKVDALRVMWMNIPHREKNPFGELGYFVALAYSNPKKPEPSKAP